ncbi:MULTISPECIES: glycosyltransferase [Niastella]|uniref:Glycosyltransferase n=1 Tax=Niastella soli TaxID=2821487 RepID=A0ABS3YM98_9BACT|nr:glycosyltransferase [Niastella soli]MBO9199021.1 glycosyltransferase [Niastella soli]
MDQRKKKYWLITTEYPPMYGGGIGTYCYHTAKMLQQQDWDVTVFVPSQYSDTNKITTTNGIRIVEFSRYKTKVEAFLGPETSLAFEFANVIREFMETEGLPDILESQEYAGIAYYILQFKHLNYPLFNQLKVVLTLHAPSFLYYEYNRVPAMQLPYFWIGQMERWCIMAADKLNAPSAFIVHAIKPFIPDLPEVTVVPLPFEQSQKTQLDNTTNPRDNWFFFGKLTPQKGIVPLLKGFRELWLAGWKKPLFLIGGGNHYYHPERMDMQEWVNKKYGNEIKAGKLIQLGSLSPAQWKEKTRNGAVILIPSIGDNYPYTVIESLINGNIVLASKQGGQTEILVNKQNGFLFDHNEENSLEKQVHVINDLPIEQIREIRINAIKSVEERHNYQNVYAQKLKVIESAAALHHANRPFPFVTQSNTPQYQITETGKKDLLSIVVPFYNMGAYVNETLESIYSSDYKNIEVIVVNDGSNDQGSIEVLKTLQNKYQFTLVEQTNKGLSAARNKGVQHASGEFLAFLDPDDTVQPTYFSKAINILQSKQNVFFVGCWAQYFERSTGSWPAFIPEPPYLLYHNMINSSALIYKKIAFTKNGWNDAALEYGVEDWESVINLVKNGWRGVVIPEKLWNYRIRQTSMVRNFTREKLLFSYRYIAEKHAAFYALHAVDLTGLLNANGPGYKIDNPTFGTDEHIPFNNNRLIKKAINYIKKKPALRKRALYILSKIKK